MNFFGIICFSLISLVYGDFFDLSKLGDTIQKTVEKSLEPLNNLGERIDQEVRTNLGGLDNLGSTIEAQVQQSLLPLKAMTMKLSMMNGVGGKTIKQFPDGIRLLVEDGVTYKCSGNLNNDGTCDGTLEQLNTKNKINFCYMSPNVKVNNYLCFTSGNSGVSVQDINGHVSCKSSDDSPVLLISNENYKKMCGNKGGQPIYTYIANVNDPTSVKIPNDNPYVKCENNTPNICIFA